MLHGGGCSATALLFSGLRPSPRCRTRPGKGLPTTSPPPPRETVAGCMPGKAAVRRSPPYPRRRVSRRANQRRWRSPSEPTNMRSAFPRSPRAAAWGSASRSSMACRELHLLVQSALLTSWVPLAGEINVVGQLAVKCRDVRVFLADACLVGGRLFGWASACGGLAEHAVVGRVGQRRARMRLGGP